MLLFLFVENGNRTASRARISACRHIASPANHLDRTQFWKTIAAAKHHKVLELGLKRFEIYGNTFKAQNLTNTIITTREPQNMKTVLSLRFKDYGLGNRIKTFGPLLGHGIFTADGEHWAQSRSMVRLGFSKDRVAHLETFEELMKDLLKLIPTDGSTVDLQDLFFCAIPWTLRQIFFLVTVLIL
jgi:cytochrome P450